MKDEMLDEYLKLLEAAATLVGQARREPDANKRANIMKRVNGLTLRMAELYDEIYSK